MHPINSFFDTGAGKNLIREDILQTEWLRAIQSKTQQALQNATNQKVSVVGTIMLHFRMTNCRVGVIFGLVRNLAVPVLLDT